MRWVRKPFWILIRKGFIFCRNGLVTIGRRYGSGEGHDAAVSQKLSLLQFSHEPQICNRCPDWDNYKIADDIK